MLLAIDIGNSNLVFGIHQQTEWKKVWRLQTLSDESASLFYNQHIADFLLEADIKHQQIKQVMISSVVPALTPTIIDVCQKLFHAAPVVLTPLLFPSLPVTTTNPYQIGADLVANAVAAHHRYPQGSIIVDFGTALTFTTVSEDGQILGVAIAPGIKTAISSLYQKTAQLPPDIPLVYPSSVVGKDTIHAIQSGIMIGYTGLVRHMIQTIRRELDQQHPIIATGGLSGVITALKDDFDIINPHLTLDGLKHIADIVS